MAGIKEMLSTLVTLCGAIVLYGVLCQHEVDDKRKRPC